MTDSITLTINLMVQLVTEVMPVALIFGFTNLLLNTVSTYHQTQQLKQY